MTHKCKFCSHHFASYRLLRHHAELDHPVEFTLVSQWLGKVTDVKIEQYEKIAHEGLFGHTEHRRSDK